MKLVLIFAFICLLVPTVGYASDNLPEWTVAKYYGYDKICQADELIVRADAEAAFDATWGKPARLIYNKVRNIVVNSNLYCLAREHRASAQAAIVHATVAHISCREDHTLMGCTKYLYTTVAQLTAYAERDYLLAGWYHISQEEMAAKAAKVKAEAQQAAIARINEARRLEAIRAEAEQARLEKARITKARISECKAHNLSVFREGGTLASGEVVHYTLEQQAQLAKLSLISIESFSICTLTFRGFATQEMLEGLCISKYKSMARLADEACNKY